METTLYEFFAPGKGQITQVAEKWAQHELPVAREIVAKAVSEELAGLLDVSLVGIMLRAWSKYELVRKYLASNETVLVPLLTHTIESTHEPSLDLTQANIVIKRVQFSVSLEIEVEGLVLKIGQGRIQQIEAGNFTASGSLDCEGVTVAEKKLRPLNIPASYRI
jgi:hypothetical protein